MFIPDFRMMFCCSTFQNPLLLKAYSRSTFFLEPNDRLTTPLLLVVPSTPERFAKSVKATTRAALMGLPSALETTVRLVCTAAVTAFGLANGAGRGALAG